uniref:DENN/MADD domain containing 6B n=1 Tax=Callorhinchus milii TaxID=7868 RepID=A0A4W3JHI0_CALMI
MDASGSLATGSARRYVAGDLLPESLPWDRFSSWLECVCVVTFDLELGQAIEKTNICYLSFPDSYSGCLGDTQFSFRIRQSVGHKLLLPGEEDNYNQEAPVVLQRDPAHYYGYVYFRQVKDNTIKRGYFQKSLVLISQLPFVNLFHSLLNLVAPEYFEKLEPCLEAVCNEIDQWPSPAPGKVLSLPIMGVLIQVRIPSKNDKIGASPLKQSNQEPILIHIQMLWELMLLGEPVIVMAPSPTVSSETILALISCIAPLRYFCDYRPYFTIHDSEFREYMTRTQAPPNVVLGVTNPFFIKTFQHWPHILRIGDVKMSGDLPKQIKVKKLTKLRTLDTKPGIYTSYKTFLHKDKALIKRLLKGIQRKRPEEAQNAILRRHVLELTQSFIIPLERYVASLMPLQRTITAWKVKPAIVILALSHIVSCLVNIILTHWALLRRFFKSPNFDGWFRLRHQEMARKLQTLHLEVLCETDLLLWVRDKSEVEIVDLVLKLREKLETARIQHLPVNQQLLHKLESYINTVISSLPEDLQAVLQQY